MLTVVDTDGEPLKLAVRAEADVVSPNELEAEELAGHEFADEDDRARAVVELTRQGPSEAIMTVADGCYAYVREDSGHSLYRVTIEPLEAQSPIGSGDAFLAGYVAARYQGRTPVECLRFGVACGAESTQHVGAGIIDPATVERLLDDVAARTITLPRQRVLSRPIPAAKVRCSRWLPPSRACVSRRKWGSLCHPFDLLRCADGSRDWAWKEGPPGLWI